MDNNIGTLIMEIYRLNLFRITLKLVKIYIFICSQVDAHFLDKLSINFEIRKYAYKLQ